jgi:peptidoglycan/LPS O-acetylase OafA/YrhL
LNATSGNRLRREPPQQRTELPALTSLRGIAALTVLLFHSSNLALPYPGGANMGSVLLNIWSRGYLAVDLFFFLSGFVLTHVYGSRLAHERNWRVIGGFLWARFCRIHPASAFAAGICVLQFILGKVSFPAGVSFKAQLIGNLTLMQVPWLDTVLVNPPSWSISAEFYAYLMFPLLVPVILRLKTPVAVALGGALLTAIAVGHQGFDDYHRGSGWPALIRAVPEFVCGIVAYLCYSRRALGPFWKYDATLAGVVALIIAACALRASNGVIIMLLSGLLTASVCNTGRLTRLIGARPLRWLGEVSYSVYIFQAPMFILLASLSDALVRHGFSRAWLALHFTRVTLGGGVLVHRCVDVPARAVLRRLPDRAMSFAAASSRCETAALDRRGTRP